VKNTQTKLKMQEIPVGDANRIRDIKFNMPNLLT